VDDRLVGSDATATAAAVITGYWRMGFDSVAGWPAAPTSNFLSAVLDESAFYPTVLTPARVHSHFAASGAAPGPAVITGVTSGGTVSWTAPGAVGISAVTFGTNPSGAAQTISSPGPLDDGVWHHLVATLSPSGMVLYVDGLQAATSASTGAKSMSGSGAPGSTASPPGPRRRPRTFSRPPSTTRRSTRPLSR
jgi:hypothetical protein